MIGISSDCIEKMCHCLISAPLIYLQILSYIYCDWTLEQNKITSKQINSLIYLNRFIHQKLRSF
jgi:hypothetical protein